MDAFVGNEGARPAFVVLGIVLDKSKLRGFVDGYAAFEEIETAVDLREMLVLMIGGAGGIDGEQMIVRRAGGMGELTDGRRFLIG